MADYSTPEIHRVPLDSQILQMIALGIPDVRKFPFIEPPPSESIEEAIISLKDHVRSLEGSVMFIFFPIKIFEVTEKSLLIFKGAITDDEELTPVGRMLSNLPVDITVGKILIMGSLFNKIAPVLSLAAALSVQTPFTNRSYRDPDAMVIEVIFVSTIILHLTTFFYDN